MMDFVFYNERPDVRRVVLEPWGNALSLPPGSTWQLKIQATDAGQLEVRDGVDEFTVFLWPGCSVEVLIDGEIAA